ncbi:MAG: glycine--tRNA ligase [Candidatus Dojkabacteria bacterium]|nr:MAG: glycine--tRNA ligase [Candidatus Dojkabacteria bacterium]GIW61576.1 MAG: glycine--tRNA ligase [Patescibacteria group bacterium]
MAENKMEKLTALFKRRGFVYPGSEIYGGLANTYDYGPVGTELLRNIRNLWWKEFVIRRDDIVGLEASIISHRKVWEASGHTVGFSDAFVDCKNCKVRIRADQLIEDYLEKNADTLEKIDVTELILPEGLSFEDVIRYIQQKKVEGFSEAQLDSIIKLHAIPCPNCGAVNWTPVRRFNLLFPIKLGIVEGEQSLAYLRGETAQGMFINFENIVNSTRVKLPFGIAQLGKSFRNEITLGNSIFRTIEFDQAEIEYFFHPKKENWEEIFDSWKKLMWEFITERLGVNKENLRWREHSDKERSFYSKKTVDLEYKYPFGFKELWGIAYRTDYDLKQHAAASKHELSIVDPETNEKIIPHVIEPALGINRLFLTLLCDAYFEEKDRIVLRLHPRIAPIKVAVFPLLKNRKDLVEKAREVYQILKKSIDGKILWDDRGNIGKRYLSQDEIGTPWCVTIDFDTLVDNTVTVRDRDTTNQERIAIQDLANYFSNKLL